MVCADGRIKVLRVKPADSPKGRPANSPPMQSSLPARGSRDSDASDRRQSPDHFLSTPSAQIRYRNLPGRQEAADPRHRAREARHRAEHLEPYGHYYKAKVSMDFIKPLKSRPNGKLVPGFGDHADAGGRKARPRRRWASPTRSTISARKAMPAPARALARPVVRHEGWRRGQRLCAGGADGGHQPRLHPAISTPSRRRTICSPP